eukprot:367371_1
MTTSSPEKDGINTLLDYFGLSTYEKQLRETGIDSIEIIFELEDEDIDDTINDINMKQSDIKTFKHAIHSIKNGTFKPSERVRVIYHKKIKYVKCNNINKRENSKTIMCVGESGAGKTTVINSICNYLYNVKYNDTFRYKLIDEDRNKKDNTQSQTSHINQYYFEYLAPINGSLTIIDTPGLGDTSGEDMDLKIQTQLQTFFRETKSIDAIYFIVKATETRLDKKQSYIFQTYTKLLTDVFGVNIKDNIFIIFTFHDDSNPSASALIKKLNIKYKSSFEMNNTGFGLLNNQTKSVQKLFFDNGMKQFKSMFDALLTTKRISIITNNIDIQQEIHNINSEQAKLEEEIYMALNKIKELEQETIYTFEAAILKPLNRVIAWGLIFGSVGINYFCVFNSKWYAHEMRINCPENEKIINIRLYDRYKHSGSTNSKKIIEGGTCAKITYQSNSTALGFDGHGELTYIRHNVLRKYRIKHKQNEKKRNRNRDRLKLLESKLRKLGDNPHKNSLFNNYIIESTQSEINLLKSDVQLCKEFIEVKEFNLTLPAFIALFFVVVMLYSLV